MSEINYTICLIGENDVGKRSIFRKIKDHVFPEKKMIKIGIEKTTLEFDININKNEKKRNSLFLYMNLV